MKKLLTILILFLSFRGMAQPVVPRSNGSITIQDFRSYPKLNSILPTYLDTGAANDVTALGLNLAGALIYSQSDAKFYIRKGVGGTAGVYWEEVGSGGGGGQVNTVTISNYLPLFMTGVGGTAADPVFTFATIPKSGNVVFASPADGSLGAPDFRALVPADIPAGAIFGSPNNVAYYNSTTGAIEPGIGEVEIRESANALSNTMGMLRVGYRNSASLGPEGLIHASGNDIGNMWVRIQNAYDGSSNGNAISYQLIDSVSGKVAQLYFGHSTNIFTGNAVMLHSNSDFIKLHSESGPVDLATGPLNVPGVNTVLRVTTAARVGIGTLTPGQKLSVIGTFSTTDSTIFRGLTSGSTSDSVLVTSSGMTKRLHPGDLAVRISSLIAASASNTIDNTNFAQAWVWSTLSNNTALSIASNSSTANSSTTQLLSVANTAGSIGSSATLRGLVINLSAGGASGSTSTGLQVSATNAVNNYAIIVPASAGNVGIGTSTPTSIIKLHVVADAGNFGVAGVSGSGGVGVYGETSNANGVQGVHTTSGGVGVLGEATAAVTTNTAARFVAQNGTNNYAILVPTASGKIGLGIAAPTAEILHVTSLNATGTTTTSGIVEDFNSLTTGTGHYHSSTSLTSGNLMNFVSTSTALAANNELVNLSMSGANGTASIVASALRIDVANTGTTNTNVGINVTALGGSTDNLAILADRKIQILPSGTGTAELKISSSSGGAGAFSWITTYDNARTVITDSRDDWFIRINANPRLTIGSATLRVNAASTAYNLQVESDGDANNLYSDGTNNRIGIGLNNPSHKLSVVGNIQMTTAGNKLFIATGSNASIGVSGAMTAGTITISTTAVTANSIIILTHATVGGTIGVLSVGTITASTSFVINSSSALDTGTVNWWIVN